MAAHGEEEALIENEVQPFFLDHREEGTVLVGEEADDFGAEARGRIPRSGLTCFGPGDEPAADLVLSLEESELDAARGELACSGETSSAGSDDHELVLFDHRGLARFSGLLREEAESRELARDLQQHLLGERPARHELVVVEPVAEDEVVRAEKIDAPVRQRVLALEPHSRLHGHATGRDVGHAVDAHQAVRARTGHAEGPARAVVLGRAAEDQLVIRQQRARDRLAFFCLQLIAIELDGDGGIDGAEARHGAAAMYCATSRGETTTLTIWTGSRRESSSMRQVSSRAPSPVTRPASMVRDCKDTNLFRELHVNDRERESLKHDPSDA